MKPLTTLGEIAAAKGGDLDWRAQLRAADIDRRPPPSQPAQAPPSTRGPALLVPLADIRREEDEELARLEMEERLEREREQREREQQKAPTPPTPFNQNRPDRGYIDQSPPPEPPPRRRVVLNPTPSRNVALIRPNVSPEPPTESRPAPPPPERETRQFPLPPPERSSLAAALSYLTPVPSAPPEPEPAEMPKRSRRSFTDEYKEETAKRILRSGKQGEQARVAKELGLSQGSVSNWVITFKKRHPNWTPERDVPPVSRQQPSNGQQQQPITMMTPSSPGPLPQLQVHIEGLDKYIEALVDARVKLAVGAAFQRFAGLGNFGG